MQQVLTTDANERAELIRRMLSGDGVPKISAQKAHELGAEMGLGLGLVDQLIRETKPATIAAIQKKPGWGVSEGGRSHQVALLLGKAGLAERPARLTGEQARAFIEHIGMSTGAIIGKVPPGLFDTISVRGEYWPEPKVADIGESGNVFVNRSFGINRPITIVFSGPAGTLQIEVKSPRHSAYESLEGLPMIDHMGRPKLSSELPPALRSPDLKASYSFTPPAPQEIAPETAATFFQHLSVSSGSILGKTKPGVFESVTVMGEHWAAPLSKPVSDDGSFFLNRAFGTNRPITAIFEGPGTRLELHFDSPSYGHSPLTGIPLADSFGKIGLASEFPKALDIREVPASYLLRTP